MARWTLDRPARSGEPTDPVVASTPEALDGRYELTDLLGRGGAAEVYRGHDRRLGRAVAVKVFPAGVRGPDGRRQNQELRTLSQLHHPHLIELYDAGTDAGRAFLVMHLVDGPSLDRVWGEAADADVGGGKQTPRTVAGVGRELADALAYVHAEGVTHRDIKPANVLLDGRGRALLGDFGIALLVETTRVTETGSVVGTAAYMAPEQVRGDPVGPASDVYSLGLVLLEGLTAKREYPGAATESACARLHRDPVVPPLPAGLDTLLRRMTDQRPEHRPRAAEVARSLDAVLGELSGTPGTVPVGSPTPPASASPRTAGAPATDRAGAVTRPAGLPRSLVARVRRPRRAGLLLGLVLMCAVVAATVLLLPRSAPAGDAPAPTPAAPAVLPPLTPTALPPIADSGAAGVAVAGDDSARNGPAPSGASAPTGRSTAGGAAAGGAGAAATGSGSGTADGAAAGGDDSSATGGTASGGQESSDPGPAASPSRASGSTKGQAARGAGGSAKGKKN